MGFPQVIDSFQIFIGEFLNIFYIQVLFSLTVCNRQHDSKRFLMGFLPKSCFQKVFQSGVVKGQVFFSLKLASNVPQWCDFHQLHQLVLISDRLLYSDL